MKPSNIDPISLRGIDDPENAPCLVEHIGSHGMNLCFENEFNRQTYLNLFVDGVNAPADGYCQPASEIKRTGTYN